MLHTAAEVKEMLTKLIHHLKSTKSLYVKNPKKDFTRERKLSFEKVITCFLGMGGGSLDSVYTRRKECDRIEAS